MSEPKISAQDVMKACAGMLQKQLYVVTTTPANGMAPVIENLGAHLKFQIELERKGIMFGAGPFWSDDEQMWEGGLGLARPRQLVGQIGVGPGARAWVRLAHIDDQKLDVPIGRAQRAHRIDVAHVHRAGQAAGLEHQPPAAIIRQPHLPAGERMQCHVVRRVAGLRPGEFAEVVERHLVARIVVGVAHAGGGSCSSPVSLA